MYKWKYVTSLTSVHVTVYIGISFLSPSQLARKCEQVLIKKFLDVFFSEFLDLLQNDRNEGVCVCVCVCMCVRACVCMRACVYRHQSVRTCII